MRFWTLLFRSCRLRCPRCGQGRLFRGWLAMHPQCDHCQYVYARGPGYFLGSIYFNYGFTALITAMIYLSSTFIFHWRSPYLKWTMLAFCVLFPLWFFRYARSLWVGLDQFFDPVGKEQETL